MLEPRRVARFVLATLIFANSFIILAVLYKSRQLRPLADDYCYGAVATLGPFESINHWWSNWSGEVAVYSLKTLLVGSPLANGITFASAIPFFLTVLSLGLTSFLVLQTARPRAFRTKRADTVLLLGLVLSLIPLVWWVSLHLEIGSSDLISNIAGTVLHWQDVNIGYVLAPSLAISLTLLTLKMTHLGRKGLLLIAGIGIAVPLLNPAIGATLIIAGIMLLGLTTGWGQRWDRDLRNSVISLLAGITVGLIIFYSAPGTRNRLEIQETAPLEPARFVAFISNSVSEPLHVLLFPGFILVLLVFFIAGTLIYTAQIKIDLIRLKYLLLGLFSLVFSLIPVTLVSQYLNYAAPWHWVSLYTLSFLAVATTGIYLGLVTTQLIGSNAWVLLSTGMFLGIVILTPLMLISIQNMNNEITQRYENWNTGAAVVSVGADITPGSGWGICWAAIEDKFVDVKRNLYPGYEFDRPPTLPLPEQVLLGTNEL